MTKIGLDSQAYGTSAPNEHGGNVRSACIDTSRPFMVLAKPRADADVKVIRLADIKRLPLKRQDFTAI